MDVFVINAHIRSAIDPALHVLSLSCLQDIDYSDPVHSMAGRTHEDTLDMFQ